MRIRCGPACFRILNELLIYTSTLLPPVFSPSFPYASKVCLLNNLSSSCSSSCKSGLLISHRPGRVLLGFGGYRWYPPGLAPPAAFATRFHFCPHSFILIQFQMDLLAFSAAFHILLSLFLLSPPPIPRSLRRDAIEEATAAQLNCPHSNSLSSCLSFPL